MLVLFGVSFIGGFDLTLPSSWVGSVDSKANRTTGFLSIFLMAFTLVLVSFSCTGPIVGFLLVEVVTANIAGPVAGMLGFSLALALPFTLFALFPGWLKAAPKSGSWMHTVKLTLGYVELAFSLKFLSVADMAYGWGILPRTLFIALWIALAAALVVQLALGQKGARMLRLVIAAASLAFAAYLLPGLWGAPLKAVSAFTPPLEETGRIVSDFDEGLALAKQENKRVFVDFTGYGCVNCRKMEATVFQDERVRTTLSDDYVVVRLYVDDKTPLPEPLRVESNGRERTLRTVGDRWSHLQATRFGAQTQPFYVILDADGTPLAPARSYDEDADAFLRWLN
jgi:thiol:disulfide interchange protein DsbD